MERLVKIAATLGVILLSGFQGFARAAEPPKIESYLVEGNLAEGERALEEALKSAPGDDNARFALGVVQFLRAVEVRMQAFYRHGYRTDAGARVVPLTNLPIPPNPDAKPLDYRQARSLLQNWLDELAKVEATLAGVKDPRVKLPLHFGLIRLDFNGDGRHDDEETLWKVYNRFNQQAGASAEGARDFLIAFDRGDVDWLRGYSHFLTALTEVLLAHDFEELFNNTGHLLFKGVKPRYAFLARGEGRQRDQELGEILDAIALIHLVRLPVVEPGRLKAALRHMDATIRLSRSSWKAILAETDDDHEWIPSPKQATVVRGVRVTGEMMDGWNAFLNEFEAILAGRKLLPFWRGSNPRLGVNARRVLTEPRTFDLVLWVQGTAAAPFLEEGEVTSPDVWQRLNRVFQGEFIGFALWFN
jgi:hypothetical protein